MCAAVTSDLNLQRTSQLSHFISIKSNLDLDRSLINPITRIAFKQLRGAPEMSAPRMPRASVFVAGCDKAGTNTATVPLKFSLRPIPRRQAPHRRQWDRKTLARSQAGHRPYPL